MGKEARKAIAETPSQKRGRPRSDEAHENILGAAYSMLMEVGFAQLTIEGVAARAGVGKPTIYRRWANKARLVVDAFLHVTSPELSFPDTGSVKEDIRLQMQKLVRVMNSSRGQAIATLIGGGQTDPEMIEAFLANWLSPRRSDCSGVIKRGMERGELLTDLNIETVIDALYSPLFYRLLLKHAPLTEEFVNELIDIVMPGLTNYTSKISQ